MIRDIGLVTICNYNYGNNLTNFALFTYLKENGYSVLLIDSPLKKGIISPLITDIWGLFKEKPYEVGDTKIEFNDRWEIISLNDTCKMFLVGSDQLWRDWMFVQPTQYYTCLDWVYSNHYKAAYATSFGCDEFEGDIEEFKKYICRFQAISVREETGVDIIDKQCGSNATCVADPVFLLPSKVYKQMSEKSDYSIQRGCVTSYFLDREPWKENTAVQISERYGTDNIFMTDILVNSPDSNIATYEKDIKVEDWLKLIEKSEIFMTDSFHGLCFAIIFRKQFWVLFNKNSKRGFARIESLLKKFNLQDRLVLDDDVYSIDFGSTIDYKKIEPLISQYIQFSQIWLNNTIENGMKYSSANTEYDKLLELSYKQKQESYYLEIAEKKNRFRSLLKEKNLQDDCPVIVWGAGSKFKKNIESIQEVVTVTGVCDKNEKNHGKELVKGCMCCSPEDIDWENLHVVVIITIDNDAVVNSVLEYLKSYEVFGIGYKDFFDVIG